MEQLLEIISNIHYQNEFDCYAIGLINFKSGNFYCLESFEQGSPHSDPCKVYFDLASLTKPLTLGLLNFLRPELFNEEELLLLNHIGGVRAWGRLDRYHWMDYLRSLPIHLSECVYSDLSFLKLMLRVEEKTNQKISLLCSYLEDVEIYDWTNPTFKKIRPNFNFPMTGIRNGKVIRGEVHDDNAYYLNRTCSHAGLFSKVDNLCQLLLNFEDKYQFINHYKKVISKKNKDRFINGWDKVENINSTLAGTGCSKQTIGHLGFTGTSIWIDLEKEFGYLLLTNATKYFWYNRTKLNELRIKIGQYIWKHYKNYT